MTGQATLLGLGILYPGWSRVRRACRGAAWHRWMRTADGWRSLCQNVGRGVEPGRTPERFIGSPIGRVCTACGRES
jgi:hypothetical protein